MAHEKKPTAGAIRDELDRILQSPVFRGSDKQKGFLKFIVNETLAGNTSQLKGYTVAVSVYGRRADFDPQIDPIVRVEAKSTVLFGFLSRTCDTWSSSFLN